MHSSFSLHSPSLITPLPARSSLHLTPKSSSAKNLHHHGFFIIIISLTSSIEPSQIQSLLRFQVSNPNPFLLFSPLSVILCWAFHFLIHNVHTGGREEKHLTRKWLCSLLEMRQLPTNLPTENSTN